MEFTKLFPTDALRDEWVVVAKVSYQLFALTLGIWDLPDQQFTQPSNCRPFDHGLRQSLECGFAASYRKSVTEQPAPAQQQHSALCLHRRIREPIYPFSSLAREESGKSNCSRTDNHV